LVLAAISLLVSTGVVATCPATLLGTERQLSGSQLCTVEFFLNRYQTLLGAMIALMAALYAVSPVWRQLRLVSVQAATDLLPHLHDEAAEIAVDETFLTTATQIEQQLVAAQESVGRPGNPVGDAIGALEAVWRSLQSLQQAGSIDHYVNRITLSAGERERRQLLASLVRDASAAREQIMKTVNPPGGMPIGPYYEQILPQFSRLIASTIPPVALRLRNEIAVSLQEVQKMKIELRARTEMVVQVAKGFAG
jgi:hypothetical protein